MDNQDVDCANIEASSTGKRKRAEPESDENKYETRGWYLNMKDLIGDDFRKEFRISKDTFDFICKSIEHDWPDKNYIGYPVEECVAIALWRLANGAYNEEVTEKIGIDSDTFARITLKVYELIETFLKEDYLRWPDTEDRVRIKEEYKEAFGMPNVIGSLYTHHLTIMNRKDNEESINSQREARSFKDKCSIPVQGVIDSKGRFIDIFCRDDVLGSKSDEEVLEMSEISKKVGSGEYIIGGESYPLEDWLMVPYPKSSNITPEQLIFRRKIDKAKETARKAFGKLVGRWAFLEKQIKVGVDEIPKIVRVCCILHNICKVKKDKLDPKFRYDVGNSITPISERHVSPSAIRARDSIAIGLAESNVGKFLRLG